MVCVLVLLTAFAPEYPSASERYFVKILGSLGVAFALVVTVYIWQCAGRNKLTYDTDYVKIGPDPIYRLCGIVHVRSDLWVAVLSSAGNADTKTEKKKLYTIPLRNIPDERGATGFVSIHKSLDLSPGFILMHAQLPEQKSAFRLRQGA